MLQNDMREKLAYHKWVDIRRKTSNPSQTLNRFTKQANLALDDLALLAKRLPEINLGNMFTYKKIRVLLRSILYGNNDYMYFGDREDHYNDMDYNIQRAQLAALMARTGINFCIEQYESKIEQNSILNEPIINQLKQATKICDEIVSKLYLPQVQSRAQKEKLNYLFDGAKIPNIFEKGIEEIRDENVKSFVEFCGRGSYINRIKEISCRMTDADTQEIRFDLVNYYDGHHVVGSMVLGIEINIATLYNSEGESVKELVLRKEDNGWHIFEKIRE